MLALTASPASPDGLARREVADPVPRPDEALVAVRAVSLNRGELRRLPSQADGFVPGWDVAGTVLQPAADGSGPAAGARVAGLVGAGAWAERAAVPTHVLAELPEGVSFAQAATLPVAGLTALGTLAVAGPTLGRRVLVTGAAGGVGRFALQVAARGGAHVTAVAGSERRAEGLRGLGADEVVLELAPTGPTFDVILESAGGASLAAAFQRIAPDGTLVTFGNSSGEPVSFDASSFYGRAPGARVYGYMVFREVDRTRAGARDLRLLAELVAAGELDPQIALEASWDDPHEAISALTGRRLAGKAVLHLGPAQ